MMLLLLLNEAPNPLDAPPFSWCHCIIFLNAIPLSSQHCCCFSQHSSFSLAQLQLLLDITMFLLLFDNTPCPWHCSCFFSTMFLINTTPRCCSYSSLSFLFNVVPTPTPRCHSYFYLMSFLLLFDATPTLHISSTFMLPLDVVVIPPFDVAPTPPISNWYFPPSYFCRCGRRKLSKFNCFRPSLKVNLIFSPNVYLLMTCSLFWLSMFFWIILVNKFLFLVCKIYLDIKFNFNFKHCISFSHLHCIFSTHCIFFNLKKNSCKCLNWFS